MAGHALAKGGRGNKKQAAFDPSELDDLIFSPAVGSGVGSHLLTPTVVTFIETTVVALKEPTVVQSIQATVESPVVSTVVGPSVSLWITESGELVSAGRVKAIESAGDVLTPGEESVYRTLWSAGEGGGDAESPRLVQAGYDVLVKRSGFAKKTIQRIVAKLIDKDFIAIERQADIYRRTSTVYRVFGPRAVLERHRAKRRSHVAKMGPGFSYARPIEDPR